MNVEEYFLNSEVVNRDIVAMKIISCEFHLFIFQYPISNTEYPIINST